MYKVFFKQRVKKKMQSFRAKSEDIELQESNERSHRYHSLRLEVASLKNKLQEVSHTLLLLLPFTPLYIFRPLLLPSPLCTFLPSLIYPPTLCSLHSLFSLLPISPSPHYLRLKSLILTSITFTSLYSFILFLSKQNDFHKH